MSIALSRSIKSLFCFVIVGALSTVAHASVKLKVSASNPSQFREQAVPIKSYLPKGIRPENVISAGGLDIGYDVKKGQCYVYKEVVLPPKQAATYQVEIDDIWLIREEDLEKQRSYTSKLGDQLQNSEYAEMAQKLVEGVDENITTILSRQGENLIEKVTPIEHIAAYELNLETWEQIKEDIGILENMIMALLKAGTLGGSAGGMATAGRGAVLKKAAHPGVGGDKKSEFGVVEAPDSEEQQSDSTTASAGRRRLGSCISEEAIRYANIKSVSLQSPEDIKLTIGVQNPSDTESQTIPLRYYLAQEVRANDVLDPGGLSLGFDFGKSIYYLFRDDLLLGPAEKKTFDITLRNKWVIDKFYLLTLKVHADNVALALGGRAGFEKARQANEDIQFQLDQLLEEQSSAELTEEYVGTFRNNQQKLKDVEQEIRGLEDMLIGAGVVAVVTAEAKEKLCEEERARKMIAAGTGVEAIKEFKIAASTIFKGKAPKIIATWELIAGIVIFLGILSSTFYYVQIKEQKSAMLDALTGAFSRTYITERFREELKIAQNTNGKCSLLVLDIDKFKSINDTYGHAIGDTILKEFIIAIRKGVRATDMVGRFGGDEFLIILPTGDKERAKKIAEGIAKIVAKYIIQIKKQMFNITTSIGVATYPDDSRTAEDMFLKADSALYQTKRKGGNGVSVV